MPFVDGTTAALHTLTQRSPDPAPEEGPAMRSCLAKCFLAGSRPTA